MTTQLTAMQAENIERVVQVFAQGSCDTSRIGIELEHTIVHAHDNSAVTFDEEHGVSWLLAQMASDYSEQTIDDAGELLGLARAGQTITLEPGEQVEISAGPFADLSSAQNALASFENQLHELTQSVGMKALAIGYHPTAQVREMSASPKRRYELLAAHLDSVGDMGRRMMYGTASTQVSIDYRDEADCVRKMRLASIISPLLALMTDNAPFYEGAPRPHKMIRTEIWNKCDPARCGIIPGVCNPDFSWHDYARWVLSAPAIMVYDDAAFGGLAQSEQSALEFFAEKPMDARDIDLALSLVFPDVRLKNYLEIRPADSLPASYAIAYAALIRGLFTDAERLDALDELVGWAQESDIAAAKEALMQDGYSATVYGMNAGVCADGLLSIAKAGLFDDEQDFLEPLESLILTRTTLAECLLPLLG